MRTIGKQDKRNIQQTTVAQFGEGNFLRAFVDYMIDIANELGVFEGGVALIKPIPFGSMEKFEKQDSTYTVILRGKQGGEKIVEQRIISAVNQTVDPFVDYEAYLSLAKSDSLRFVVSNTTEAGITYDETDRFNLTPANSFPGKLTQFLYARYTHFHGSPDKGLIILPVELIEDNGKKLRECVQKFIALWGLPEGFAQWVNSACIFCSTLVDRIISGYPKEEVQELEKNLLGYHDDLLVVGEPFGLWVIESDRYNEVRAGFPLDKAGMPVVFTDNQKPYRERKVRILNGAHTATVLAAYLTGLDTVGQCMGNPLIRSYIEKAVYEEIAPTLTLPRDEVKNFADCVMERFENPFIRHELLSISLNSVSKWRARVLPSLKDYLKANGTLPTCLTFSLAALTAFYRTTERSEEHLIGRRGADTYPVRDDQNVLNFFATNASRPAGELAAALLSQTDFWGEDLTQLPGLCDQVTRHLRTIDEQGMAAAIETVIV